MAIPNEYNTWNVPWVDPQLFRFRAKNAYTIKIICLKFNVKLLNEDQLIQDLLYTMILNKVLEELVWEDNIMMEPILLGSDSNCLIYMKDPKHQMKIQ